MFSMPPAIIICWLPALMLSYALRIACNPEAHILLIVTHGVWIERPAAIAACRAGAWPNPAVNTQPILTPSILETSSLVVAKQALIAAAPSSGVGVSL